MKHITTFFAFAALLLSQPAAAQQWERLAPLSKPLQGVATPHIVGDTVFLGSGKGVYRSTDRGDTWHLVRSSAGYAGVQMNPYNKHLYWVEGIDSSFYHKLYSSADLGNTWQQIGLFQANIGAFIGDTIYGAFFDPKLGGVGSKVGNAPWKPLPNFPHDPNIQVYNVQADGRNLWAVNQKGIFHSPDAGHTWKMSKAFTIPATHDPNETYPIMEIQALKGEVLAVNRREKQLYYSRDSGVIWQLVPWNYGSMYNSREHIYVTNRAVTRLFRFEGGKPDQWTDAGLESTEHMEFFGIAEHKGSQWATLGTHGVFRRENGAAHWLPANGPLEMVETLTPCYLDGHLLVDDEPFADNYLRPFSSDNGTTWQYSINGEFPKKHWQDETHNYIIDQFEYGFYIWSCPRNGRFIWERIAQAPEGMNNATSLGDTIWTFKQHATPYKTFVSYDRGKTWPGQYPLPTNSNKAFVRRLKNKLYFTKEQSLYRSDDHGATWKTAYTFPHSVQESSGRFFIVHDTLLISYPPLDRIYFSADGGQTFDTLQAPKKNQSVLFWLLNYGDMLLLYQGGTLIHLSKDIGKTWVTAPLPPGITFTTIWNNDTWAYGGNTLFFYKGWRLRLDSLREARGKVFLDLNSNGQRDGGEIGLNQFVLQSAKDGILGATYNEGDFSILLSRSDDALSVSNVPSHYVAFPSAVAIQGGTDNIAPVNFAIRPQGSVHDDAVSMTATAAFRAGYDNTLYVNVENVGTLPAEGQLKLRLDPLLTLLYATPPPNAQSGDTLIWDYTGLGLLREQTVRLDVNTAVVPPGTPVSVWAAALNATDADLGNNTALIEEEVVSSFDPNDKKVSAAQIPLNMVQDEELVYTIRFQNLGNIETDFITVRDTLSTALDASSVRVLMASHPHELRIEGGRILVFRFNPIRLAPAQLDSLRSQGFVQFSVRIKPGLKVGDEIANTAHIYFDYNPAIVTNTAVSAITVVSTFEPLRLAAPLRIFPNPSAARATLQLPGGARGSGQLAVFSPEGRLLYTTQTMGEEQSIDVSPYPTGVYWCRWMSGETAYWGKLVVER